MAALSLGSRCLSLPRSAICPQSRGNNISKITLEKICVDPDVEIDDIGRWHHRARSVYSALVSQRAQWTNDAAVKTSRLVPRTQLSRPSCIINILLKELDQVCCTSNLACVLSMATPFSSIAPHRMYSIEVPSCSNSQSSSSLIHRNSLAPRHI